MTTTTDVKSGLEVRDGSFDAAIIRERNVYLKLEPRPGDCVLDVGANIGAVSDLFASKGCSVVAVEPEPSNLELLRRNVARYGDRVAIIPAAAGAVDGPRQFFINKGINGGLHSTIPTRGRDVIAVNGVSFESLLTAYHPTLLKVDIEGGEYELAPWLAHLPEFVRGLAMELHLTRKGWRETDAPNLIHWVELQGFKPVKVPKCPGKHWATVGVWLR